MVNRSRGCLMAIIRQAQFRTFFRNHRPSFQPLRGPRPRSLRSRDRYRERWLRSGAFRLGSCSLKIRLPRLSCRSRRPKGGRDRRRHVPGVDRDSLTPETLTPERQQPRPRPRSAAGSMQPTHGGIHPYYNGDHFPRFHLFEAGTRSLGDAAAQLSTIINALALWVTLFSTNSRCHHRGRITGDRRNCTVLWPLEVMSEIAITTPKRQLRRSAVASTIQEFFRWQFVVVHWMKRKIEDC